MSGEGEGEGGPPGGGWGSVRLLTTVVGAPRGGRPARCDVGGSLPPRCDYVPPFPGCSFFPLTEGSGWSRPPRVRASLAGGGRTWTGGGQDAGDPHSPFPPNGWLPSPRAPVGHGPRGLQRHGDAWGYFTHDQARSRAYRWGEDGWPGSATTSSGCASPSRSGTSGTRSSRSASSASPTARATTARTSRSTTSTSTPRRPTPT